MSKTIKCIISVVFGLTLLFAANLTASAEIYPSSVAKYGTSKEIQFTSETLYYRNSAEVPNRKRQVGTLNTTRQTILCI